MSKAAAALLKRADAARYSALHKKTLKKIRREYFTATGRMVTETQTACVLALHFNVVPDKHRETVKNVLSANLKAHGGHLTTGVAGTPFLCFALSDNGMHGTAAELINNRDYPGWLYQVLRGATTVWERWNGILPNGDFYDPSMNSFNHYAYGSIAEFFYRRIAGIDFLEAGYKKIRIEPRLTAGMSEVYCSYESAYGKIVSSYKPGGGKTIYTFEVPANTTAQIFLPHKPPVTVGSGTYVYEAPYNEAALGE
jgi:alpha-L-rhamnosidase